MGIPSISVRKYIRLDDQEAEEPTSTIVLTSQTSHFVDIRLFKSVLLKNIRDDGIYSSSHEDEEDSRQVLEWAFAGTSHNTKMTELKNDQGEMIEYSHSVWDHWIDSKIRINTTTTSTTNDVKNKKEPIDEGDLWPQPNGDVLERGTQLDPVSGEECEYEELWGEVQVQAQAQAQLQAIEIEGGDEGKRVSVVLKVEVDGGGDIDGGDGDGDARGLIVRVGQYCQGILQVGGDEFTVERWEWMNYLKDEDEIERGREAASGAKGRWCCKVRIGDGELPCDQAMDLEGVGDGAIIQCGGLEWRVMENYRW